MTTTPFQLLDNKTFVPADVSDVGDGLFAVFTSPELANGVGDDLSTGILLVADYHDLQSSPSGAELQAVVEGRIDQDHFYTVAYQFEEFSLVSTQQRRQIVMSQDLVLIEQGVNQDSKISLSGQVTDQVSRQYGVMLPTWRVRVLIRDPQSSFQSVRMSIYGCRYNQSTPAVDIEGVVTDNTGRPVTDAGGYITS